MLQDRQMKATVPLHEATSTEQFDENQSEMGLVYNILRNRRLHNSNIIYWYWSFTIILPSDSSQNNFKIDVFLCSMHVNVCIIAIFTRFSERSDCEISNIVIREGFCERLFYLFQTDAQLKNL